MTALCRGVQSNNAPENKQFLTTLFMNYDILTVFEGVSKRSGGGKGQFHIIKVSPHNNSQICHFLKYFQGSRSHMDQEPRSA